MKKLTKVLFFLLLLSQISVAQITLTSANAPAVKTGHRTRDMDTTAAKRFNVGATGGNLTWNFSATALDPAPAVLTTYVSPTGAPSASSFPTATLIGRDGLTNAQGATYYRINASEWVILGDVDSTGEASVNQDPEVMFKYPFTLNSTFKDTFDLEDPDFGTVSFKSVTSCDAWGSVQTSLGTFNSLRVKRVNDASIPVLGIPVSFNVTTSEWWTTQYSAPVISHSIAIISLAGIVDTGYFGTILTAQTVGTQEVEPNHVTNAFPSPANQALTLDVDIPAPTKVAALIISMNGQTLKTRNFGDLQAGKQQINFDVTDLATGSYQIILMSDKGKLGTQKIVVAH